MISPGCYKNAKYTKGYSRLIAVVSLIGLLCTPAFANQPLPSCQGARLHLLIDHRLGHTDTGEYFLATRLNGLKRLNELVGQDYGLSQSLSLLVQNTLAWNITLASKRERLESNVFSVKSLKGFEYLRSIELFLQFPGGNIAAINKLLLESERDSRDNIAGFLNGKRDFLNELAQRNLIVPPGADSQTYLEEWNSTNWPPLAISSSKEVLGQLTKFSIGVSKTLLDAEFVAGFRSLFPDESPISGLIETLEVVRDMVSTTQVREFLESVEARHGSEAIVKIFYYARKARYQESPDELRIPDDYFQLVPELSSAEAARNLLDIVDYMNRTNVFDFIPEGMRLLSPSTEAQFNEIRSPLWEAALDVKGVGALNAYLIYKAMPEIIGLMNAIKTLLDQSDDARVFQRDAEIRALYTQLSDRRGRILEPSARRLQGIINQIKSLLINSGQELNRDFALHTVGDNFLITSNRAMRWEKFLSLLRDNEIDQQVRVALRTPRNQASANVGRSNAAFANLMDELINYEQFGNPPAAMTSEGYLLGFDGRQIPRTAPVNQ